MSVPGEPGSSGPGPIPPALLFSDRAGEEAFENASAANPADPLSRALRSLDFFTATDVEGSALVETAVGQEEPGAALGDAAADESDAAASSPPAPEHTAAGSSRREEILDGAAALFAERGYHGSSLRDISRRVGISHPGMLHHFSSKDALLGAVIDRLEAHAQGLLDSTDALSSSAKNLEAALGGPWHPARHPMALLATLSAEIVNPEHPGRFRVARLRLVHEHILETVLSTYAQRGELTRGARPAFIARSTFSLLLSLAVREQSVRALQRIDTAEPVEDVREFVRQYVIGS